MFRKLLVFLSRHFPPKAIAERVLPWLSVALAVFGAAWGLAKYGTDLDLKKVGLAIKFHERYTKEFFKAKHGLEQSNAPFVLRYRCDFLLDEIEKGSLQQQHTGDVNCKNLTDQSIEALNVYQLVGEQRAKLREHIFGSLGQRPLGANDIKSLAELSIFFNSIIICVDHGNCDEDAVVALFSREMTEFVNMACAFFERSKRKTSQTSDDVKIAEFLIRNEVNKNIYWSLDPGREKLFACDYLRELETS